MERFQYNKYNTSNNAYNNSYDNPASKNKYNKSKYVIQSRHDETTNRYTANNRTNTNNIANTNKIIKTTISCCESICDENGQVIPNGNYYFTIKEYNDTYCKGSLSSKGEYGEFIFKNIDVIAMMSNAQSRLARRAGVVEHGMPNNLSPPISPENNKLKPLNQADVVYNYFFIPENCSICLNMISDNKKRLNCNHSFHSNCILQWFQQDNRCPICRDVQSEYEEQGDVKMRDDEAEAETEAETEAEAEAEELHEINRANSYRNLTRDNSLSNNIRRRYNNYIIPVNNFVDPTVQEPLH
jgi:hypothetical protein